MNIPAAAMIPKFGYGVKIGPPFNAPKSALVGKKHLNLIK